MNKISVPVVLNERFDKEATLAELRRAGAHRTFLSLGAPSMKKENRQDDLARLRENIPFFKSAGLEVGVWFWTFWRADVPMDRAILMADKSGKERIFYLFKLRTMSNKKDKDGKLLPDSERLNSYGRFLRSTSADELPSLINIIKGEMSIVGPRPQLVKDMVFMTEQQRSRHDIRPGLTGLAQVNGRNNITWEKKFEYDLEYIERGITLENDLKIILKTVKNVIKRSDTVREGTSSDLDFGDWLMLSGKVDKETYYEKQEEAIKILRV